MAYTPTIGLEIHAELKTSTKMFCRSKNDPLEVRPNVNICPVCMAHPGTLPVINREAVRHVLRVGLALSGTQADYTEFDRKNYFYPDLPKGYQLSQYEFPLISGGALNGVAITRVHLEEDTASSIHDTSDATLIDYNRAGVPLMELVTEPVIKSGEEAGAFARELQLLLRYLDVSDADMEKGQMRLEANISISDSDALGTKVEIKNINSFRAMERAVAYEIERQKGVLEEGGRVEQETRGWDDASQSTFSQRTKEGSADYRYFPDPDLPSLQLSEVPEMSVERLRATVPELPWQRRARYASYGIKDEDADSFVRERILGAFFEATIAHFSGDTKRIKLASNYIANDLVSLIRDVENRETELGSEITLSSENFARLITLVADDKVSSRSAKDILQQLLKSDQDPNDIAREKDLFQLSDNSALEVAVGGVLAANPTVVADYQAGKASALEYLLGQCMKALRGAGDPKRLREVLTSRLAQK